MSSQHHSNSNYPEGRVRGPGLLYGGIGLVLAGAMQAVGLFHKGDAALKQALSEAVFAGGAPDDFALPLLLIVAAAFSFGVAFAVLDSPGSWRRLVLGITAIMVVLAMVPTFAVWQVYFSPFLPAVALFWTWFCSMMYTSHHIMPCDVEGVSPAAQAPPVAAVEPDQAAGHDKEPPQEPVEQDGDPDAKYQPRELNDGKVPEADG